MTHASVGQVCWTRTPLLGGLVAIVRLGWMQGAPAAQVWHVLDHPSGYMQGLGGWVALRDLQPCFWPEADDAPGQGNPPAAPEEVTVPPTGGRR